jgi:hypothetical protein
MVPAKEVFAMLKWIAGLVFLVLGAAFALGGYVTYERSPTVPTMQQLGMGVHNLWHPDYPSAIP